MPCQGTKVYKHLNYMNDLCWKTTIHLFHMMYMLFWINLYFQILLCFWDWVSYIH
jgi:hypothetical protein